jgi:recombination associated protein RdgC
VIQIILEKFIPSVRPPLTLAKDKNRPGSSQKEPNMGILKGVLTYQRFFLEGDIPQNAARIFEEAVESRRFMPLTDEGETMMASGWVPTHAPLADDLQIMHHDFIFDDRLVITYREDELRFPKDYIRARLAERAQAFEEETGEKPTKAMLEAFEAGIRGELRRRLLPGTRLVDVVWDMASQEVRIFTRSKGPLERLQVLFERTFNARLLHATYGQRAFKKDLNLRSMGMLENLEPSPAFEPKPFQTHTLES